MARETELDAAIARVESRLDALAEALRLGQAEQVAAEVTQLQRALAAFVQTQRRAAPPSAPLRQRLARAGARIAAQREALARAGAAADRALELLLPGAAPGVAYAATGLSERPTRGGMLAA